MTMKSLILAAAIGLSCLTIAGCVSESGSYDGGYNGRPRDYSDRYGRPDDRVRERNEYAGRHTERRDRDYRRGDRRCVGDPRCEVPEYNAERPGYYRRDGQAQGY